MFASIWFLLYIKSASHLPVDVKVGVSGSLGVVEAVLVLRSCRPGGVWRRSGNHHEERLVTGFILEELQRPVSLGETKTKIEKLIATFALCL